MPRRKMGVRTITVIRRQRIDRLSSQTAPTAAEHDIEGCSVLPRAAYDRAVETGKGWVILEGRMIVAPFGSDILADDQIRIDGTVWEVDGEIARYETRRGKERAAIFYLKRLGT